jgi:hypothetical protein
LLVLRRQPILHHFGKGSPGNSPLLNLFLIAMAFPDLRGALFIITILLGNLCLRCEKLVGELFVDKLFVSDSPHQRASLGGSRGNLLGSTSKPHSVRILFRTTAHLLRFDGVNFDALALPPHGGCSNARGVDVPPAQPKPPPLD